VPLRAPVPPGERGHFAFELPIAKRQGRHRLQFVLVGQPSSPQPSYEIPLFERTVLAEAAAMARPPKSPLYGARYVHHNFPDRLAAGSIWVAWVCLENTGTRVWRRQPADGHRTDLAVYLDGELYTTVHLPCEEVLPQKQVHIQFNLRTPAAA